MSLCAPVLLSLLLSAGESHADQNPVYQQLRTTGISVGEKTLAVVPAPTIADGMDSAAQQAAVAAIPRLRVSPDVFLRDSVTAPFAISVGDLTETDAGLRLRTVEVWFVAYGNFDALRENRQWLESFLRRSDQDVHVLTEEELKSRNVPPTEASTEGRAGWTHTVSQLLERVELSATTYTVWSNTPESTLAAGLVDSRFLEDAEYPNQWRPITSQRDGTQTLGSAKPYSASASYMKATRLKEPSGAILLEYHTVFNQPAEWFGGRDLIRSKLPMVVQSEIRNFRRKLKGANR